MPFQKGKEKTGGREQGVPNKLTKTVKETVLQVFNQLQEDDKNNLSAFAEKYPRDFYAIAAKLIPTEINAKLNGEIETGLPQDLELLYQTLPDEFTRAEAAATCVRINLKERRFDISIRRKDFGKLFQKTGQGKYKKS